MFRNRNVILVLCAVLVVLLGILLVCERKDPEAGSELIRRLLNRGA